MVKHLVPILLFFIVKTVFAQDKQSLHMPLNVLKAYDVGTRSYDGEPGGHYWQNNAKYDLKVTIDVENDQLKGKGQITYFNNSPDTLGHLIIRLYQDIFKYGAPRDWPVHRKDMHEGTDISKLVIDNNDLLAKGRVYPQGTNTIVTLPDFLMPGTQVILDIEWSFPIPVYRKIRYGKYADGTYFIAYWYPEVAVYDDIDGWDNFNFGGMQEFYHDISDFQVTINMPKNFIVWATGELQNAKQILKKPYFQRYQQAKESEEVVKIIKPEDLENKNITKGDQAHSWVFKANKVPDFAFATSDQYLWDAATYKQKEKAAPDVFISSAYDVQSEDFYEVADISLASVRYFSEEMPAIPFPYPAITIFNGSGGMEFPMMVNDGSMRRKSATVHVTTHEIAHMYFPFLTGTNERKYAWMDEGWAVMLPLGVQKQLAEYKPLVQAVENYEQYAGHELEVPLMISSINLGGNTYREAYRNHAYYRSAVAYYLLNDFLGEELFLEALQAFISRWRGKHPIPFDFFFTFNEITGEDLNWFWKPWFYEKGYPDLSIKSVEIKKNKVEVLVRKNGRFPVPVQLNMIFEDGSSDMVYHSCDTWKEGHTVQAYSLDNPDQKKVKRIVLGSDTIPDVNDFNNYYEPN